MAEMGEVLKQYVEVLEKAVDAFAVLNESFERIEKVDERISPFVKLFSIINPFLIIVLWFTSTGQSVVVLMFACIWLIFSFADLFLKSKWVSVIPIVCQYAIELSRAPEWPTRRSFFLGIVALMISLYESVGSRPPWLRFLILINTYGSTLARYRGTDNVFGTINAGIATLAVSAHDALKGYWSIYVVSLFFMHGLILRYLHVIATMPVNARPVSSVHKTPRGLRDLFEELVQHVVYRLFLIAAYSGDGFLVLIAEALALQFSLYFLLLCCFCGTGGKKMILGLASMWLSLAVIEMALGLFLWMPLLFVVIHCLIHFFVVKD